MQKKCCFCIPLKTGIMSIGVFTAIEAIFYLSVVVSKDFSAMRTTAFSFKIALCLFFVLSFAKPNEIMPRAWLYITWLLDFCISILMVVLMFKTISETGYYEEYCIDSQKQAPPGFWEPGVHGEEPFFTDIEQCENFIKAANRTGLIILIIVYAPIRLWLAWNIRDWLLELKQLKTE